MKRTFYIHIETDKDSNVTTCETCDEATVDACKHGETMADNQYVLKIGSDTATIDKFDTFYIGLLIGQIIAEEGIIGLNKDDASDHYGWEDDDGRNLGGDN